MGLKLVKILISTVFLCSVKSFGQALNFDKIKASISDRESNLYYPFLVSKFKESPKDMSDVDLLHLYYGKKYDDNFNPKFDKEYLNCIQKSQPIKKASACNNALLNDPTNLELLSIVYNQPQSLEEKELLKYKFSSLWKTIKFYGDGKSEESPYLVNSVGEIYTICSHILNINLMKYQRSSTAVRGGTIDKFYTKRDSVFFKVIYNLDNLKLK